MVASWSRFKSAIRASSSPSVRPSASRPCFTSVASDSPAPGSPSIVITERTPIVWRTPSSSKPCRVTSSIFARCFGFSTNTTEDSELAMM